MALSTFFGIATRRGRLLLAGRVCGAAEALLVPSRAASAAVQKYSHGVPSRSAKAFWTAVLTCCRRTPTRPPRAACGTATAALLLLVRWCPGRWRGIAGFAQDVHPMLLSDDCPSTATMIGHRHGVFLLKSSVAPAEEQADVPIAPTPSLLILQPWTRPLCLQAGGHAAAGRRRASLSRWPLPSFSQSAAAASARCTERGCLHVPPARPRRGRGHDGDRQHPASHEASDVESGSERSGVSHEQASPLTLSRQSSDPQQGAGAARHRTLLLGRSAAARTWQPPRRW